MKSFRSVISLFGLVLVLALCACSDNPAVRDRYQAEKMYFKAERLATQVRNVAFTDKVWALEQASVKFDSTVRFCYQALKKYPASEYPVENQELANLAFRAAGKLASIAYDLGQLDRCAAVLENILTNVPLDRLATIATRLNLGGALQASGNWDSALAVYNYTLETFYPPVDQNGELIIKLLDLPTRIYDVYLKVGDTATAAAHALKTEAYYHRLINDYPGQSLSGAGHLKLATLYEKLGRWEEAVTELAYLTDTVGTLATSARLRIASVHANQLDRPDLALEEYERIVNSLQGADTLRRPQILFDIGLVHLYSGRYDLARQTLSNLKKNYPGYYQKTPTVQFAIARAYELQGNWDRAETEYKYLISIFPSTEQSLSAYLYLLDQYTERGHKIEADRIEKRAEAEYDRIANKRPGTRAEAAALSYKAELLRRRGQFKEAIDLLTDVFSRFPTSEIGFRDMVMAAVIYRDDLNDHAAADSLVQELKRRLTTVDEPGEF